MIEQSINTSPTLRPHRAARGSDASRDVPAFSRPRLLTPLYGSLRYSFSGTTWHLARAAVQTGALDGAFTLYDGVKSNIKSNSLGFVWKSKRKIQQKKSGGFKFTDSFLDSLWGNHCKFLEGTTVINNTQLFGNKFFKISEPMNITPAFYIDGSLTEYFYSYGAVEEQTIGQDIVKRAIDMESEGYKRAKVIMTMSSATAEFLTTQYGISRDKIAVVLPGANIEDELVPPPSQHDCWVGDEFTLGFVGMFPLRKGLDKLAGAVKILRDRGLPVRLRVIGRCPDEIAAMDGVEYLGAIDKAVDAGRFIEAIRGVDLGCQLSRAELLGIAMLEFLRVGVPVMATEVGGIRDVLAGGGGVLVPADVSVEALCGYLTEIIENKETYRALRRRAVERMHWASWDRAAMEMDTILSEAGL